MIDDNNLGTAAAVAEITERLARAEEITIERESVEGNEHPNGLLVVPDGKKVIDLRPYEEARLAHPRRCTGTSTHTTLGSLIDHTRRHSDEHSVLFAIDDSDKPTLVAIYDYHQPARILTESAELRGTPRWCQHRASYVAPLSEEWAAWQRISGPSAPWLSQRDFAEALEDRVLEVLAPESVPQGTRSDLERMGIAPAGPSTLTTLARGLIVRADRRVGAAVNLSTGEGRITFEEQHTTQAGDAPVVVPTGFVIGVPVFRDGDPHVAIVRMRYRLDQTAVKWRLAMHRPDALFRDAFEHVCEEVRTRTGCPVFYGKPE